MNDPRFTIFIKDGAGTDRLSEEVFVDYLIQLFQNPPTAFAAQFKAWLPQSCE